MIYRDFAENRGQFKPGERNIKIYFKDGKLAGILKDAPMPDWYFMSPNGTTALIGNQYYGMAYHNRKYDVVFGHKYNNQSTNNKLSDKDGARVYTYKIVTMNHQVRRNGSGMTDFASPRMDKLVTEVAHIDPINVPWEDLLDKKRYPVMYRAGAGHQYVMYPDGTLSTRLAGAGTYLIGGSFTQDRKIDANNPWGDWIIPLYSKHLYKEASLPLGTGTYGGDSGSPLIIWDNQEEKWFYVGSVYGSDNNHSYWNLVDYKQFKDNIDKDNDAPIMDADKDELIIWSEKNITQKNQSWVWHGKDNNAVAEDLLTDEKAALNAGKNLTFNGEGGNIQLTQNVDQGAGSLTFLNNYTVSGVSGTETWQGAGIIVDKGKTVLWQINGNDSDRLHKIGQGTLIINASGNNPGELSVGDGYVILNQQADVNGNKKSFKNIDIVSGRPILTINDPEQISADNLYFGFRGGRFNINGNDYTFGHVNHQDAGAHIVNHHSSQKSDLTFKGYDISEVLFNEWKTSGKANANDLFEYYNTRTKQYNYFALKKTGSYGYFPTNEQDNTQWEFLGNDKNLAQFEIFKRLYTSEAYLGKIGEINNKFHNGEMSFNYSPDYNEQFLNLQGGMNLNGSFNIKKGSILISGLGDYHSDGSIYNWGFSEFNAHDFNVDSNAQLQIGNYVFFKGNLNLNNDAFVSIGYVSDEYEHDQRAITSECTFYVSVKCYKPTDNGMLSTFVEGNIKLEPYSHLVIGRSLVKGVINASINSSIDMVKNSSWNITDDSNVANIRMQDNSHIIFMGDYLNKKFKTLNVENSLSGNGIFTFNIDTSTGQSDKLILNGFASGHHYLDLNDLTSNHITQKKASIDLVHVESIVQNYAPFTTSLLNGYFDSGLYRYELRTAGSRHQLFNGLLEAQQKPEANPDLKPSPDNGNSEQTPPEHNHSGQQRWISDLANAVISDHAARFMTLSTHAQLLHDTVAYSHHTDSRFWINTDFTNFSFDNEHIRKWSQSGTTLWMGVDLNPEQESKGLRSGLAFGHNRTKSKFSGNAAADSETYSIAAYGQLNFDSGYQVSAETGLHYYKGDLSLKGDEKNQSKNLNWHYALGGQITRSLGFIRASSDVNLTGVYFNDVRDNVSGYSVRSDDAWNHRISTGIKAEIPAQGNQPLSLTPFINMKYSKALDKLKTINIENNDFIVQSDNSLKELGIGLSGEINKDATFKMKYSYQEGNDMKKGTNINLQVGFKF